MKTINRVFSLVGNALILSISYITSAEAAIVAKPGWTNDLLKLDVTFNWDGSIPDSVAFGAGDDWSVNINIGDVLPGSFSITVQHNTAPHPELGEGGGLPILFSLQSIPGLGDNVQNTMTEPHPFGPHFDTASYVFTRNADGTGVINVTAIHSTPEPSTILGLLTLGGIVLGASKKKQD